MTPTVETPARVPLRRRRGVRKALIGMRWTLMSVATTVIALSLVALATGHQIVAVTSGSMRPGIQPGDALIVKRSNGTDVGIGDIAIFHAATSRTLVAHRVVDITRGEGGPRYRMKGDANATSDANLVPARDIVGRVNGKVPAIGRQLYWFSHVGLKLALAVLFAFVFIEELLILIPYLKRRRARRAAARPK
jgi:signal peptidase